MRCPQCNKFVSYDEPQCENVNVEVDENTVRASCTVQLNCADCGTTLKDAEIETDAEINHTCTKQCDSNKAGDEQFTIEDEGCPEGTSRVHDKDRHGKQIKSRRYMKTFYGFVVEPEIRCQCCDEVFSVSLEGEEQASGFNECC